MFSLGVVGRFIISGRKESPGTALALIWYSRVLALLLGGGTPGDSCWRSQGSDFLEEAVMGGGAERSWGGVKDITSWPDDRVEYEGLAGGGF
jgi:hypothetical protein